MVFSLTTKNKVVQANNFGNLISVGSVYAKALNGRQIGVPQPQLGCLSVVPLTASTTNLLNATRPSGIGYITLTAGAGITAVPGIYNSYTNTTDTVYFFDTPRALVITTTGTEINITFTIWGFDEDNVFMTENIVIGGSPATFFGKKAFAGVTRIWVNIRPANAVSIGTSDIIGLPYYLLDNSSVINNNFGTGTVVASGQSTLVSGTSTISTTAVTTSSIIQLSRST